MASFWNDENTALAVKLWDEGLSASHIAEHIGAETRNVIIGKINRMRAAGHPFKRASVNKAQRILDAVAQAAAQRIVRERREAAAIERRAVRGGTIARMKRAPEPQTFAPAVIIDASFAKPWTERLFGECAFPIAGEGAETVSCCARTGGKTYCTAHRKLMYRKPEKTGAAYVKSAVRLAA